MTTITIYKSNTNEYRGFTCLGHSGFAAAGKDIVCASISTLVINTINSIEALVPNQKISVTSDSTTGYIKFAIEGVILSETKLLLDSMVFGLKELEKQYKKKYLRLIFEEV